MIYVGIATLAELYFTFSIVPSTIFGLTSDPIVLSVLGTRVLLNLKVEGEKSLQQGTSSSEKSTIMGIEFAAPSLGDIGRGFLGEAETDIDRPVTADTVETAVDIR